MQPIWNSLIYIFVFSVVVKVDTAPVPYPLFIVLNIVIWTYFSRVVSAGSTSVLANIDLLSRVQFPREFLPIGIWIESLADLGLGLLVVAAMFAYYQFHLTIFAPWALVMLLLTSILALGLGLLLAALTMLVRDLTLVIPLLLQLLLYVSPVVYPLTFVPDPVKAVYLFNPVGTLFAGFQETLLYGRFTLGTETEIAAVISVALLTIGYWVFKRLEWQFADIL